MLHQEVSDYDNEVTYLVIAWGQMVDHDITFAAVPRGMFHFVLSVFNVLSSFLFSFFSPLSVNIIIIFLCVKNFDFVQIFI